MNNAIRRYQLYGTAEGLRAIKSMIEINKKFNIDDGAEICDDIMCIGWDDDDNMMFIKMNDVKKFKKFYKNYLYSYKEKNYGPGSIMVRET